MSPELQLPKTYYQQDRPPFKSTHIASEVARSTGSHPTDRAARELHAAGKYDELAD